MVLQTISTLVFDFATLQILTQTALSLCVCVCVSLASDSSETIEVIIIKLGMVTASDMKMHHMILTFIQGHTDLNHENNKC